MEDEKQNIVFKRKPRIKPDIIVGNGGTGVEMAKKMALTNAPNIIIHKHGDWVKSEITGTLLESKVGADGRNLHTVKLLGSNDIRVFEKVEFVDISLEFTLLEYDMKVISWKDERTFYGAKNGTSNVFKIVEGHDKRAFLNFNYKCENYSLIVPSFIK